MPSIFTLKKVLVVLNNVLYKKRQNNKEAISLKINDYFASIAQHTVDSLIKYMVWNYSDDLSRFIIQRNF